MSTRYIRKRRCESPVPLKDLVSSFFKSRGLESEVKKVEVLAHWESIVGREIAANATPVEIKDHILFLRAGGAAWRTVLFAQKEELIRKINLSAGKPIVKNIMFTFVPSQNGEPL